MTIVGLAFIIGVGVLIMGIIIIHMNKSIKIKKFLQEIEELERKRTVIYGNSITHEFNKLKKMNISKESETQVIELEKTTEDVFQGRIKQLSDILYDLEDQVADRDIKGVAAKLDEIRKEIDLLEGKTQLLSNQVKAIVSTEETAAIMHADLKDKVDADLKLIKSYKNKLSADTYENFVQRWEKMNVLLEEYLQINIVTDREKADKIVNEINQTTNETQSFLYYIPQTEEYIKEHLQPKLDKVIREIDKLLKANFIFDNKDVKTTLDEIQILIDGIRHDIATFKSRDFQEEFDITINFLNQLEKEILIEVKAHSELPKKLAKIEEYSREIKQQFDEFKKGKQNYVKRGVDNLSVSNMEDLASRFNQIKTVNEKLTQEFKNPVKPFSKGLEDTKLQLKIIAEFRDDVNAKSKILKTKVKEEKDIIKLLDIQREKLNRGVVAIEAVRMPVIPDWYYIDKGEVVKNIELFDQKIKTSEYNIPELIELANNIKEQVNKLTNDVSTLIDYYKIAKDTIVYLNRFLEDDEARIIKQKAVDAFGIGNYADSAKMISEYLQVKAK